MQWDHARYRNKSIEAKNTRGYWNFFFNKITSLTKGFQQIHIVFDTYKEHSLKSATRERRRRGENAIKYKVSPKLDISKLTIKKLLTHIETKKDLTKYLSNLCSERLMQQKR